MADLKISELTNLTAADPANDMIPIVDVSATPPASGSTKRISINNILACSPTATLASATISGDLTVDTSTLKVDSANNRVGIGTASPAFTLDVQATVAGAVYGSVANNDTGGSGSARFRVFNSGDVSDGFAIINNYGAAGQINLLNYKASSLALWTNSVERFTISSTGVATWSNVGGVAGTAMTLNATGLGVGVSPSYKLDVQGADNSIIAQFGGTSRKVNFTTSANGGFANGFFNFVSTSSVGAFSFQNASGTLLTIDSGGNVGIGVTPSAWGSNWRANHVGTVGSFASSGAGSAPPTAMVIGAYNDNTNWKYQFASTGAARYEMTGANAGSVHAWYTAPGGTIDTNITFTQAMTLAANGQLLLGTSTTTGSVDIGMVLNKPSATGFVGNVYQLNGVEKAFTYISSAAGAFRVDTVTGYTINMVSATNGVYLANGGTSWTALSDERFKDIIEPISNAVAKVGSIRSVIGKFKTESEGTRRSFLIAQDVQAVLPEAVDASNPEKLGVSYTEVIPLLVAAIKELTAEVNALKNA